MTFFNIILQRCPIWTLQLFQGAVQDPSRIDVLVHERGIRDETTEAIHKNHVEHDPRYLRPTEVDMLRGDASKAREELGWKPKVGFDELVKMMADSDLVLAEAEQRAGIRQSD